MFCSRGTEAAGSETFAAGSQLFSASAVTRQRHPLSNTAQVAGLGRDFSKTVNNLFRLPPYCCFSPYKLISTEYLNSSFLDIRFLFAYTLGKHVGIRKNWIATEFSEALTSHSQGFPELGCDSLPTKSSIPDEHSYLGDQRI
jgi:hypothetical protein